MPTVNDARPPRRVVVLGIGNTILSDEGLGVHALAALQARFEMPAGVECVDGGTAGMELLDVLSGVDLLLVLDAVRAPQPPGAVIVLAGAEVPVFFRSKLSPHQVSICDVLASLEFSGDAPRHLLLVGMVPESLELGLTLTETVAARLPTMVNVAATQLAGWGVALAERAPVPEEAALAAA